LARCQRKLTAVVIVIVVAIAVVVVAAVGVEHCLVVAVVLPACTGQATSALLTALQLILKQQQQQPQQQLTHIHPHTNMHIPHDSVMAISNTQHTNTIVVNALCRVVLPSFYSVVLLLAIATDMHKSRIQSWAWQPHALIGIHSTLLSSSSSSFSSLSSTSTSATSSLTSSTEVHKNAYKGLIRLQYSHLHGPRCRSLQLANVIPIASHQHCFNCPDRNDFLWS